MRWRQFTNRLLHKPVSMKISSEQIRLIRQSWKIFQAINPALVADTFYARLFHEHPSLRKLFPADMQLQYAKLMDMLTTIVTRLDRTENFRDELSALAERHTGYGVKPAHYQYVGTALLWTLEQGLGADWTPELAGAWRSCYAALSEVLVKAEEIKL